MTPAAPPLSPEAPVETRPLEPRPKTPREVGEHAARYIEEHGWTRTYTNAGMEPPEGTVCAWLAVVEVVGEDSDWLPPSMCLASTLRVDGIGGVFDWNDAPERTEAEVLAALRAIR